MPIVKILYWSLAWALESPGPVFLPASGLCHRSQKATCRVLREGTLTWGDRIPRQVSAWPSTPLAILSAVCMLDSPRELFLQC